MYSQAEVRKMEASVTHGFVLVTANPIDTLFPGEKKLSDLKEGRGGDRPGGNEVVVSDGRLQLSVGCGA